MQNPLANSRRKIAFLFVASTIVGSGSLGYAVGKGQEIGTGDDFSAVQVSTDKASYRPGEPIVVTVVNGLSMPIHTLSGQTYCTIVTVQRSVGGRWSADGRCFVFGPPAWLEIAAGRRITVEVKPRIPADHPFAPGRYRVMLTFTVGSTSRPSATAFSPEFLIGDQGRVPSMTALTSFPCGQLA